MDTKAAEYFYCDMKIMIRLIINNMSSFLIPGNTDL